MPRPEMTPPQMAWRAWTLMLDEVCSENKRLHEADPDSVPLKSRSAIVEEIEGTPEGAAWMHQLLEPSPLSQWPFPVTPDR